MERTKRDLEAVINSQKEQLTRYEKRLKDVVTAYKGLLKEKEALETSLTAVTTAGQCEEVCGASNTKDKSDLVEAVESVTDFISNTDKNEDNSLDDKSNLQTQIATLMNSLATLSAEKSRMEASFQADKKQIRFQLQEKEQTIKELQNKIKENKDRAKSEVEENKAKWIIERQEREKETNNQMLMIRELQKLYADERHLKENIEMQLNNFKTNFANNEAENFRVSELQAQLKDTKAQLKQVQSERGNIDKSNSSQNNVTLMKQLQLEMAQLKEQHAVAIKNEQRRVQQAEDLSRKQTVQHEDRVANLEARLAELSKTVGSYDRLRQQDQESIQLLKNQLQTLEKSKLEYSSGNSNIYTQSFSKQWRNEQSVSSIGSDVGQIVDEIMHLKKVLLKENTSATSPIDLTKIFSFGTDHTQCQIDLGRVTQQLELLQAEIEQYKEKIAQQKCHISTLQEKVKVLNCNIDEQEIELKHFNEKMHSTLKEERSKWKTQITEMENEYRCKLNELEQQLQKQRQRSLQLLDEKEQEIKALQTSFEIFHSSNDIIGPPFSMSNEILLNTLSSDAESNEEVAPTNSNRKMSLKSKKLSLGESCHMLHYANEIARKDIKIANLRKAKYSAETSMRKAIHDKVVSQEDLNEKIATLEEHVDRLERCKTREGANLEYLKNVIISYIICRDVDGKRHMMKAISEVLQLTQSEMQTINSAFLK